MDKNKLYKEIKKKENFLPFYFYDYKILLEQINKVKNHLPTNGQLFYSMKANSNPAILRIMIDNGLGLEASSEGELNLAINRGANPKKIILAGFIKSDKELQAALKYGVGQISIESVAELNRLNNLTKGKSKKQAVFIRVNRSRNSKLQFGIEGKVLRELLTDFEKRYPNIELSGLHFYESNQNFDLNAYLKNITEIFIYVQKLKNLSDALKFINIGGGFGATANREFPAKSFLEKLEKLIKSYNLEDKKIVLELGRYFINKAGGYVAKVIDIRETKERDFLVLEGGIINHLLRIIKVNDVAAFKKRFLSRKDDFNVFIVPKRKAIPVKSVICGQLATSADTFGRSFCCDFKTQKARRDDLVVIMGVGAYGYNQALSLFGMRALPAEFMLEKNQLKIIRKKIGSENFLHG